MMLEWRTGDPPLVDEDGIRLLFKDEVAERKGVKLSTITWYTSAARRARRGGAGAHFPASTRRVRRTTIKRDGKPVTSVTPVWREPVIEEWIRNQLGPGGKPRSEIRARTG